MNHATKSIATTPRITTPDAAAAREALARLAPFHYRPGPPSTPARSLVALDDVGTPIGILCTAFPTLNAPWRAAAWPHHINSFLCPRARALSANSLVRTISRVIIHPQWRGTGLAVRLVREYLNAPDTPLTETVASMAQFCPFFHAAGMRRIHTPPSRRDARFARVLHGLNITALSLTHTTTARASLRHTPALRRAVLTWANDSKATRRHAHADNLTHLAMLAAQSAHRSGPVIFVAP